MPKTSPVIKASTPEARTKTMTLLKKPETIVGVLVLSSLSILAFNTFSSSNSEQVSSTATDSAQIADTTDPSSDPASDQAAQLDASSTADEPAVATETIDDIALLANTSSDSEVTAQRGDTFWKIAEVHCGSGAAAETLERANGYRFKQLQAGDVVEIICQ